MIHDDEESTEGDVSRSSRDIPLTQNSLSLPLSFSSSRARRVITSATHETCHATGNHVLLYHPFASVDDLAGALVSDAAN